MTTTKRLMLVIMAMVMVFASIVPAMAATNGTITISNPSDVDYKVYLMFELESYNKTSGTYAYTITDDWKAFVTEGYGKNYFTLDGDYVTWTEAAEKADLPTVAQEALKYAEENSITPTATLPDGNNSYAATGLTLGYYLVDSSLGVLCGLTTADPDAIISEKNDVPKVEKELLIDVNGNGVADTGEVWDDENNGEIGDTVSYHSIITVKPGAENYVLHDKMDAGLTLDKESVKVEVVTLDANGDINTVAEELVKDTDWTIAFDVPSVHLNVTGVCTFELALTKSYLNGITEDTYVAVSYTATINENAEIAPEENVNRTRLEYGNGYFTEESKTETYVFMFDLIKTDSDNVVINGAEFELYDAREGGNKIPLVAIDGKIKYRVATAEEAEAEGFKSAVIEAGDVYVQGLAGKVYWLEEIAAPAGYNALEGRIKVDLTEGNLVATVTGGVWQSGGVHVVNETGALLPSTGGIGTTIFYIIGGILVVGAFVLLVAKKRMNRA